jgi:hypothetical protein
MKEVYCITWSGTGRIHTEGCYFDRERAERHLKACNDALRFWHRLLGHGWYIQTVKVKEKT